MHTYECGYCGVTFRRVREMRACAVCGQSIEGQWFYQVAKDDQDAQLDQDTADKPSSASITRAA